MSNKPFKRYSADTKGKADDSSTPPKSKSDKVDRGGAKVGDMNGEAKQTKK